MITLVTSDERRHPQSWALGIGGPVTFDERLAPLGELLA
jgi:hypothetical protein